MATQLQRAMEMASRFYLAQGFAEPPRWEELGDDYQAGFLHLAELYGPRRAPDSTGELLSRGGAPETTHSVLDDVAAMLAAHGMDSTAAAVRNAKRGIPEVPLAPR